MAAYHLRIRLHRIAIGNGEAPALGWLELWPPAVGAPAVADLRLASRIERRIIVLLAGSQAERLGVGRASVPGSSLDFYEAMRCAERICHTTEEMSAYLRWLQLRTRALVRSRTWHQPIVALAQRLIDRRQLGAREARAVIRRVIAERAANNRGARVKHLAIA